MSNVISNIISTIATQASAHPLEVAGGIAIVGGLTVVACKVSIKIHRFVLGFFGGMLVASLFVTHQLAKIPPYVKVSYNLPLIALTTLGGGFLGGWYAS